MRIMAKTNWVQINVPKPLIEKIDEMIANNELLYANRNQFCTSVLIKEIEKVIDRNLKMKE